MKSHQVSASQPAFPAHLSWPRTHTGPGTDSLPKITVLGWRGQTPTLEREALCKRQRKGSVDALRPEREPGLLALEALCEFWTAPQKGRQEKTQEAASMRPSRLSQRADGTSVSQMTEWLTNSPKVTASKEQSWCLKPKFFPLYAQRPLLAVRVGCGEITVAPREARLLGACLVGNWLEAEGTPPSSHSLPTHPSPPSQRSCWSNRLSDCCGGLPHQSLRADDLCH